MCVQLCACACGPGVGAQGCGSVWGVYTYIKYCPTIDREDDASRRPEPCIYFTRRSLSLKCQKVKLSYVHNICDL